MTYAEKKAKAALKKAEELQALKGNPADKEELRKNEEEEPEEKDVDGFVTKEDFESFKKDQERSLSSILGFVESLANKDKKIGQDSIEERFLDEIETKVPVEEELQDLTGKQLAIFEKYFDLEDGFKGWYNVNENIFTIEVPMKLSNMIDAQKNLYKQDLRSKKVDQNNVLGSIEAWCKLVCQNLKYNRRLRLK